MPRDVILYQSFSESIDEVCESVSFLHTELSQRLLLFFHVKQIVRVVILKQVLQHHVHRHVQVCLTPLLPLLCF